MVDSYVNQEAPSGVIRFSKVYPWPLTPSAQSVITGNGNGRVEFG